MSVTASGGAGKRQRKRQVEEEDGPASMQVTAHAVPLTLLAVFKFFYGMLVWMQLCSPQGVALFSFVHLSPRVPRPFAGAPVHDMSLTRAERLRAVGCGFKGKLVQLLALSVGDIFEPQRNRGACRKLMQSTVRWVASQLLAAALAAARAKAAKEAEKLCASGQFATAEAPLQRAIYLGDLPSRALKAWLLIEGREGAARDEKRGFELAECGVRLGCHHCQGVMACCFYSGLGCEMNEDRSLELARTSSESGSKYGQFALGDLHFYTDEVAAFACYRLAAVQGLDAAQAKLGEMYYLGFGVVEDNVESQRWYQLAAAQGVPVALYWIAYCHMRRFEGGGGTADEAICWFRRAQAAGHSDAACKVSYLRKLSRSATALPPLPLFPSQ